MDKFYRVFVSSTFIDLIEERQAVMQALLELDCLPAGMELFPASNETAWELIRRELAGCDYYICIVGGRYGSRDAEGISYTEREYDEAVRLGLPVLGFVHENPAIIPHGKSETDPEAVTRLNAFREKVRSRHCKPWKNADDLGSKVSRGLVQQIKLDPREGWVRARFASSPERINDLRSKIDDLERQLDDARVKPPVGAEGLASGQYLVRARMADRVTSKNVMVSWDQIISVLGPLMLNEASETQLDGALEAYLRVVSNTTFHSLNSEDFQTIKTQLFALGIIQQSDRKRTVSDTKTYWTLTPYGRHYMLTLKAIKADTSTHADDFEER